MPRVLAYHITWGTYGTRLHGDPRKTVDRENNEYGTPVLGSDPQRLQEERDRLKFPPVKLTTDQCIFVEDTIPSICDRGRWTFHMCACAPDHVHIVLSSTFDPDTIRKLLKRWLGQAMSEKWPLSDKMQSWWRAAINGFTTSLILKMPKATFRANGSVETSEMDFSSQQNPVR